MEAFLEPVSVLSLGRVMGLGELDANTLRHWFFSLATGGANHEQDTGKYAISDAASSAIDDRIGPLLDHSRTGLETAFWEPRCETPTEI